MNFLHILQNFCSIRMKFGTENVYSELLSDQLHENQKRKGHTLLRGRNEFLSVLSTFIV